jgi:predicted membrane protein
MRLQGQVLFGLLVVIIGLALLLGNVLDIDVGQLCFPIGLILLGLWLLLRPRLGGADTALRMRIFGPIRRGGIWSVGDEEIWLFIGDVRLDMSQAEIAAGVAHVRVFSFIGNVRLQVPEGVAVRLSSMAFINDVRLFGRRRSGFLFPIHMSSQDYDAAERKVHLETMAFISDMRAKTA